MRGVLFVDSKENKKSNSAQLKTAFKSAFPITIPVLAGYLVLGFGFGLLLQEKGYNFLCAILMSITIYGGSMQYVGVDLLANSTGLVSAALVSFLVQARHLFYGLSLLSKYENTGKVKPYLIFGITDETYSLVSLTDVPDGVNKGYFYFFITLLDQCYWIIGGAIGAIFGQVVNINTKGVDFSMTALFIVLLTDNLMKSKNRTGRLPSYIGIAAAFVCLLIFGAENFLIPSMIAIAVLLMLLRPVLSKGVEVQTDD